VNSLDFSIVTVNTLLVYTFVAISCGWALLLIARLRAAACTKSTLQRTVGRSSGNPLVSVIVPARNEMQLFLRNSSHEFKSINLWITTLLGILTYPLLVCHSYLKLNFTDGKLLYKIV
jgi:hypothetical protein